MRPADAYHPLTAVLVATDFSEGAGWALERALLLPFAPGATLELLHVLPADHPVAEGAAADAARAELTRLVASLRARTAGRDLQISASLAAGAVHVEVIRHSRQRGAELVVIGRHGSRSFKELLVGPAASRIVRKGDVPVLVVKLPPAGPYRHPLIGTDLQDAAARTFDLCLRVLGPEAREIDVAHGYHVPFEGFVAPVGAGPQTYRGGLEAEARSQLAALLAGYQWTGVRWNPVVRVGEPRRVLLEVALAQGADLLAVGTHGRTGISHALIGSVAESVLLHAPCDVLVARPVRFQFEPP